MYGKFDSLLGICRTPASSIRMPLTACLYWQLPVPRKRSQMTSKSEGALSEERQTAPDTSRRFGRVADKEAVVLTGDLELLLEMVLSGSLVLGDLLSILTSLKRLLKTTKCQSLALL